MKKTKLWKKIGRTGALLLLAVCMLSTDLAPVLAVTQAQIDNLKGEAKDLEAERKALEAKLKTLANDKAKVLERREVLDQQIENTSAQIRNVESQIADYTLLIEQTEAELADAEQREEDQYDLFCKRVRAMEEQGDVSYWAVLFGATVGLELDRLIARHSRLQPVKALTFQAIGAERVEALCDAFCADIRRQVQEQGCCTKMRFSPGYGDVPLTLQRDIFRVLDCARQIGLTLNGSLLMTPSKSVTAIVGIGGGQQQPDKEKCSACAKGDCTFRNL